ncbi:MAG: hypothetical protein PWQ70_2192 [Clostridiales bacterium]|nr:hypothetical protein [Clostridiales bacterium]
MNLEEIKKYLEENKDNDDVKAFVQGLNPITKERIETFVRTEKEGKSWLDSQNDKYFQKALETWKTNNLQKLIDEKIKELYPEEDPKDIELKKMKQEIEKMKKEKQRESLLNKALKIADEKKLPKDILDYFIADNEENTLKNLDSLEKVFSTHVENLVNERLKSGNYTPPKGGSDDETKIIQETFRNSLSL